MARENVQGLQLVCREFSGALKAVFAATGSIILVGCVSLTAPVSVGKDTYMIGLGATGGFSSDAELLAESIRAASSFCAQQGKDLEVQSSSSSGVQMWTPQSNQVIFKCLSK